MRPRLIRGGRILDPATGHDGPADLRIGADGRIEARGPAGSLDDRTGDAPPLDARGRLVLPGFVDLHVHLRDPGFEHKETVASGAAAAAAGGFTTVCCMPNTAPAIDDPEVIHGIVARAAAAGASRVLPVAAVTVGRRGRELAPLEELAAAGAVAFSDDGDAVTDARLMRAALERARALDRAISVHEEDPSLVAGGVLHEGAVSRALGLPGRPAVAEDVLVARDLVLAEETGGALHIGHISSARSVAMVASARARGVPVTAEVTPHHLVLDESSAAGGDTRLRVNPPIRSSADREALVAGLRAGHIDCVATDHAPHAAEDKQVPIERAAPGMVGLETALGLLLRLVERGELTLEQVVSALTVRAARCFGLDAGTLAVGAPADVTIVDLEARWTVDPARFRSRSRNTPFGGWELPGRVVETLVEGETVHRAANGA